MLHDEADDRIAVLLHLLGDEAAGPLLEQMRPERAADLRRRVEALQQTRISARRQEQVLAEFERFFQFAARGRGPRLRVRADDAPQEDATDDRDANNWEPFEPTDRPHLDLKLLTPYQIARCVEQEHPRTAAIVLRHVPAEHAARIIRLLPDAKQEAMVLELSGTAAENAQLTEQVLRATVRTGVKLPPAPPRTPDAIQRIADLLRAMDKVQRTPLILALQTHHPATAAEVIERLYVFEDILVMDSRAVQRVLSEVDTSTLAQGLRGASQELVDKIMTNLSKRARDTLRDEMEFQTSVRPEAVTAARKMVAQILARADQEG